MKYIAKANKPWQPPTYGGPLPVLLRNEHLRIRKEASLLKCRTFWEVAREPSSMDKLCDISSKPVWSAKNETP